METMGFWAFARRGELPITRLSHLARKGKGKPAWPSNKFRRKGIRWKISSELIWRRRLPK